MKGIIYKLTCSDTNKIYYGSTQQTLTNRFRSHRKSGNVCRSKGFVNPTIEEVETIEFENINELLEREAFYIKNNECVNFKVPLRVRSEWFQDNKERVNNQTKKYRTENKEAVNLNVKKYRNSKEKVECECGGKYLFQNKARHLKCKKHLAFI